MTSRDITQLNMLYVEASKPAKSSTITYYSAAYSDYADELEFDTHDVSNISEAIYQALLNIGDEESLGDSLIYINDQQHTACFVTNNFEEFTIICNNRRKIKSLDEDTISDMLRSITDNPASEQINTQDFIDNYKRLQNYKSDALAGSNDEAGIGDMLDVL